MAVDNDVRGWIMAGISGVACVVGASIICVDVVVRLFPGMHKFSIAKSDAFLSASLSLSFGVMLFSSLYSMLPQSKRYLEDAGYSPRASSYLLIGLFLGGVIGIRILSRVIHNFIPSHVVDCDHTHDEEEAKDPQEEMAEQRHDGQVEGHQNGSISVRITDPEGSEVSEDTPLLSRSSSLGQSPKISRVSTAPDGSLSRSSRADTFVTAQSSRKASIFARVLPRRLTNYVSTSKGECDEDGPCMGYSDPCGQDCFKGVQRRGTGNIQGAISAKSAPWQKSDFRFVTAEPIDEQSSREHSRAQSPHEVDRSRPTSKTHTPKPALRTRSTTRHYHHPLGDHHHHDHDTHDVHRRASIASHHHSIETDHHHHVPTNAFMSIGLQTSLAIALHKAPEGFITYATNHANPTLGFAVFMALFIHNITEGFAMSLPLYLALNSRLKAIIWSSLLGGVSQPLGAGIAALWFKVAADNGKGAPDEGVYGCMFAITSGIMTSVALSLYSESLQLSHNKGTCIAFAFLGMAILGISYALTAK